MGHEIKQSSGQPTPTAAFVDDLTGNRSLHMAANARIQTTLVGYLSSSSASLIGQSGDTNLSIPGGAVPTALRTYATGTSPTVSIGIDTTTNYFLNAVAVGTGQQTPTAILNLYSALALVPTGTAHALTGSTNQGLPVYVEIDYYNPDPK